MDIGPLAHWLEVGLQKVWDVGMSGWTLRAILTTLLEEGINVCVWATVPGFSKYKVSSSGDLANVRSPDRYLKQHGRRYKQLSLWSSTASYNHREWLVHRVVVQAFIDRSGEFKECDHVDGQPANNYLVNLRPACR